MVTALFRDEIDNSNLDVASGNLNILGEDDIERFIGNEVPFTISDVKMVAARNIVYTIGYGNRSVGEFIDLLKKI